ncbi:MAG: hypothetical protein NZM13_09095 [Cyclobacteriaceae bacterium]|nr:hypothetical protein [Cyclobacteriaceae bacterium]
MRLTCATILWIGLALAATAQQPKEDSRPAGKIIQEKVKERIVVNGRSRDSVIDQRSEKSFMPWQGKIIRNIIVEQIGFERNFYDTTRQSRMKRFARLGNRLHTNTREQMIRDNLFIRTGKPLDPFKLADNERYLRDLDFMLDATITIKPLEHTSDSVDLIVFTRDVFSIGGSFSPRATDRYRFGIYDVNVAGFAQRLELNGIFDASRHPETGYQVLYNKTSVAGSLINATLSYTELGNGARLGGENENAVFLKLDRPLVSPYTRLAGGLEVSRNWAVNLYNKNEADFRQYRYHLTDFWIGYNLGIRNRLANRGRHFVGIRVFDQHFLKRPDQLIEQDNPVYNNQTYWLGEVSFFKQNFYKTRYIYGFGRTEDLPYGRQLTLVAGRIRQLNLTRPYLGASFTKSMVRRNGDFTTLSLNAGGFLRNQGFEDVVVTGQASFFSRIVEWRNHKIRQSLTVSYSALLKQQTLLPLTLRSDLGLRSFPADSLLGNQRFSFQTETLLFTPASVLGFRLAPLVFAGAGLVAKENEVLFRQPAWVALGAGLRTRNENLVFGTIELRLFYFPRTTEGISNFRISLSSNLQVKYTAGFVKKPQMVRYN